MKHLKNRELFLLENKNNTIEVFHGGDLNDNITSPLFVTENYYQAKTYGDKLYKFELNLNSKILDLTDIKTFRKIKSKIYDNYSKLYKKYFNIGFWSSEKAVEKDYNILRKYKNYDEIEKTYKERQRSDFWDKVEGLDRYGFNGYHDDAYWAIEYAKSDNSTKEDKEFIKEFLILYRVYNNMTQLNHISLNEFGFFFLDYCKENGYDAYKAVSSDDSGKNRMIEYCIINLDILKLIGEFDINEIENETENESLYSYIKESNSNINDNFYKWFGDSKIVNEKGLPKVMYHGSEHIDKIDIFKNPKGYHFFTDNKSEAIRYTGGKFDDLSRVSEYYIKAEKIFDPQNLSKAIENKVYKLLNDNQDYFINLFPKKYLSNLDEIYDGTDLLTDEQQKHFDNTYEESWIINNIDHFKLLKYMLKYDLDNYIIIENDMIQQFIRSNGFDSFLTLESGGDLNIAVYNSNQIKSINNDGSWDINDDNIYS